MKATPHVIVYAEDDADDLYLVQQAFEQHKELIEIVHAENGFQAIDYLNGLPENGRLPCLILLDINMPGMDGREALIRIRQSERFKNIPVVLFTTSSSRLDQEFARKWDARFFTKPLHYAELEELSKSIVSLCNFEMSQRS